jgi:signal transduction histidine kinase
MALETPVDLAKRLEELERQLARKTEALQAASDEFQSVIYTITHDFRAPLRAILASCMILKEDYGDKIEADGRVELDRQANSVKKLNELLEDLLKVSRLAKNEVVCTKLSLADVAGRAAAEVGLAPEALEVSGGTVVADATLLQVALRELMSNSVKFGGSALKVWAEGDKVFVRDNACGFEQERAAKIFLPFERLHGKEFPGTGIGLALVKRSAELQGGTVGCESRLGEGSLFWVDLSR